MRGRMQKRVASGRKQSDEPGGTSPFTGHVPPDRKPRRIVFFIGLTARGGDRASGKWGHVQRKCTATSCLIPVPKTLSGRSLTGIPPIKDQTGLILSGDFNGNCRVLHL